MCVCRIASHPILSCKRLLLSDSPVNRPHINLNTISGNIPKPQSNWEGIYSSQPLRPTLRSYLAPCTNCNIHVYMFSLRNRSVPVQHRNRCYLIFIYWSVRLFYMINKFINSHEIVICAARSACAGISVRSVLSIIYQLSKAHHVSLFRQSAFGTASQQHGDAGLPDCTHIQYTNAYEYFKWFLSHSICGSVLFSSSIAASFSLGFCSVRFCP